MNTELKQKWLAALRSGDYKQTKSCLHNKDGYCCLGVLCDISGIGHWDQNKEVHGEIPYVASNGKRWFSIAPTEVKQAVAADSVDSAVWAGVIDMNDEGKTFAEIADYLEKVL